MKAAVFLGPGEIEIRDVPKPSVGDGDILLRVACTTLCGTDVRIVRGEKTSGVRKGVILGHETAGIVEEVGADVTDWSVGDLASVVPVVGCGVCDLCVTGSQQMCIQPQLFSYDLDGSLADYMLIPKVALQRGSIVKCSKDVEPEEVALAEPLACVLTGMSNCGLSIGEDVLIFGAGPIGLLWTQVAKASGARNIIVSNRGEERRKIAEQMGATHTIDPSEQNVIDAVMDITNGKGVDLSVLAIGVTSLLEDALNSVKTQGRISLFAGFPKGEKALFDPNIIHYKEVSLYGASNTGPFNHRKAVHLIESKIIDTKSLVTHRFPLDKFIEALEVVANREGIKVAITNNA